MRKYNPYRNIFYYYRGPSSRRDGQIDRQIEDNTTKALINTLENSEKNLLVCFLSALNIATKGDERVYYDLQVAEDTSRPDAVIQVGKKSIFIESKVDSSLDGDQIERHIESNKNGYLICITPREEDKEIVNKIKIGNAKFISWRDIYLLFRSWLDEAKDENSGFIVKEFLAYLEAINMAPFNGWEKRDFEAFLNIEDDPKREFRWRVREKFKQYLIELRDSVKDLKIFEGLEYKVGKIMSDSTVVWGVLCKPPIEYKVHNPHFNFWVNSDEFGMGINIEGKNPTNRMMKKVYEEKERFLKILIELEDYDFILMKRFNPTGLPRAYTSIEAIKIRLGNEMISNEDVEYIIKKRSQYGLVQIYCRKRFKRDEKILNSQSFLKESIKYMKKLQPFYEFSLSGA